MEKTTDVQSDNETHSQRRRELVLNTFYLIDPDHDHDLAGAYVDALGHIPLVS